MCAVMLMTFRFSANGFFFFATSHGKGTCDGIGGTVKRATNRESLRRTVSDQILTAQNMYAFLRQQFVSTIEFIFVAKDEVAKAATELKARFAKARTVKGTRQYHRFCPVDLTTICVHELSEYREGKEFKVSK